MSGINRGSPIKASSKKSADKSFQFRVQDKSFFTGQFWGLVTLLFLLAVLVFSVVVFGEDKVLNFLNEWGLN